MTSTQVLLVLFLCIVLVQVSLQEKEDESFMEKKRALLKFINGLESSLKHQEEEKREMEITKRREEQIKRFTAELEKLKQEHEVKKSADKEVISDLDGGKRACSNRLSAGKCQLLRWFGKGCTGKKMIVNCRASCGLC